MAWPKGKPRPKTPGSGNKKGSQHKNTKALKDMILQALDESGGVKYLVQQAKDNPGPFLALVGKVLPMTVVGDPSQPLILTLSNSDSRL